MVTVTVCNEDNGSEGNRAKVETFTLPLDLLAARSPVFASLFKGGFAEAQNGRAAIKDVSPWVFRVFVGWLYYSKIYYDPERMKPVRFGEDQKNEEPKARRAKLVNHDEIVLIESDDDSTDSADVVLAIPTGLSYAHIPGGEDTKLVQPDQVEYAKDTSSADECHYKTPVTWSCRWLFELYVFSDQYDIRDFRMSIFEVIQTKLFQTRPRAYLVPSVRQVAFAANNLPSSSPLYRFLVDQYAIRLSTTSPSSEVDAQADFFAELPIGFLSRCLVASKRHAVAQACAGCRSPGTGKACSGPEHSREDILKPYDQEPCHYHEHGGNDEEAARCSLRWESLRVSHGFGR